MGEYSRTPGPWHLGRIDMVTGSDGEVVCDVQTARPFPVTKRNVADATLIAAAPDLLSALIQALAALDAGAQPNVVSAAKEVARHAIAKAQLLD